MAYLDNNKYAIAVSGGSDSMALLHIISNCGNKNCIVVHFDHNVRTESSQEADFVEQQAKNLGFKFIKKVWQPTEITDGNFYQQARLARYNFFKEVCNEYNLSGVLVAHSQTDLAETLLMRLGKGASIKGASIFEQGTDVYGVKVFRPLLNFSRKNLQDYLTSIQQSWKNDPSNIDDKKLRPRVRKILPILEKIGVSLHGITASVEYFNQADNALNYYLYQELENFYFNEEINYYSINTEFFNSPIEMQVRALNYFINKYNENIIHLPRRKKLIELLLRLKNNKTSIENIDCLTLELFNNTLFIYVNNKHYKQSTLDSNYCYLSELQKKDRANYINKNKLKNIPINLRNRLVILKSKI